MKNRKYHEYADNPDGMKALDPKQLQAMKKGRMAELAMHPTVKPILLVADAIKDCSKRRGIILDPFGGSGTTLTPARTARSDSGNDMAR